MELSGANPLTEFAAWFFGSIAVLFVGLLIYNLYEMKTAIRALAKNHNDHDVEIKLMKLEQKNSAEKQTKMGDALEKFSESVNRLNITLALMNRDIDQPRTFKTQKA